MWTRVCRNCGYEKCKNIVIQYGWPLDACIEEINGVKWIRQCARWVPGAEGNK
jgi:hypothetical protein